MRIWLLIGAILAIEGIGVAQSAANPTALAVGDYLRTDYVDQLHKTSSPLAATVTDTPQLAQVRQDQNGLLVVTIFNFHEGGAEFALHANGSVGVNLPAGFDVSNVALKVTDAHHFVLGFDKFKPEPYVFVGDTEHYLAKKVLTGRYTDEKGRAYVFGPDGWAVFPDRKFQYQIGVDHVLNKFDYFEDKTANKVFAFKKRNGSLEVFGTTGEMSQNVDQTPLLSLTQTSDQK